VQCCSELGPKVWSWCDLYFLRYCDFYILAFWLEIAYYRPGEKQKGKDRTGQDSLKKSQSGNISPMWGEAPTVPIETKICMERHLADVITCAKFQDEIFRGYNFTAGRISHFRIHCCMGLTTVALQSCLWQTRNANTNQTAHRSYSSHYWLIIWVCVWLDTTAMYSTTYSLLCCLLVETEDMITGSAVALLF